MKNTKFWQLLKKSGGLYECKKDSDGRRLSPLVGYAGTYGPENAKKHFVGDVFANCAKLERHGHLKTMERILTDGIRRRDPKFLSGSPGFCGAPMGGIAFATVLSYELHGELIYPEKRVTAVAIEGGAREQSELIFDRHEPTEGREYWIVEDVCNNFSTTDKLIRLILQQGAGVRGILCLLNRSLTVDDEFSAEGLDLPVICVEREKILEYMHDDPFVLADVTAKNVSWKPKRREEWKKLMQAAA